MISTGSRLRSLFTNRSYLSLYLAAFVSSTGSAVTTVTLSWIVYSQTHNALYVTYLAIANIIPNLSLGMFSGVVADRFNRKRIMIAADISRMLAILSLTVYLFKFGFSLPALVSAVAIISSFTSVFTPASNSIIPQIVSRGEYENANGFLYASNEGAQMLGSALGGIIIAASGAILALVYNSATYLASAVFLSFMVVRIGTAGHSAPETEKRSVVADLRDGLGYLRKHIPVLETTLGFLPGNFFYSMCLFYIVVYSYTLFNGNPAYYGYLQASMAAGIGIGAGTITRVNAGKIAGKIMALSVIGQGSAVMGLYAVHSFLPDLAFTFVMGLGVGLINTTYVSSVQSIVPNDLLGRILGIDAVGSFAAVPLGQVAGGLITNSYGVLVTFFIAASGLISNGLFLYSLRGIRHLTYGKGTDT